MNISGTITLEDYTEARQALARDGGWIVLGGAIFLAFLLLIPEVFRPQSRLGLVVLLGGYGFIVFLTAAYWAYLLWLARPVNCAKAFPHLTYLHHPRDLVITPLGLAISSPELSVRLLWKGDFQSYHVTPHLIIAIQPRGHFQIFPKRWFTEPQLSEFVSILQGSLGVSLRRLFSPAR